jgi:hypothetical protein
MTELRVAHTADLSTEDLHAVRTLLDGAFSADEAYTEQDHEHALGGLHALLWEGTELIGHGSVVMPACCTTGGRCAPATSRPSPCAPTGAASGTATP